MIEQYILGKKTRNKKRKEGGLFLLLHHGTELCSNEILSIHTEIKQTALIT